MRCLSPLYLRLERWINGSVESVFCFGEQALSGRDRGYVHLVFLDGDPNIPGFSSQAACTANWKGELWRAVTEIGVNHYRYALQLALGVQNLEQLILIYL
jgi:hypothetical protein